MPSASATFWRMMRRARRLSRTAKGSLAQIVGHQRHVGRLQGGVGAGGAHGDAHGGPRQRRGIVDAVADHGHRPVLWPAALRWPPPSDRAASSARTSSTPAAPAMARAVASLSPVSITVCSMPTSVAAPPSPPARRGAACRPRRCSRARRSSRRGRPSPSGRPPGRRGRPAHKGPSTSSGWLSWMKAWVPTVMPWPFT